MNIEKWIIAHFSPTGGTRKVTNAIAAGFNTPLIEMDLTQPDATATLGENDALMAVLPVYAGRVPQISLERLAALKGNGQKAVAVVVYGNREYDDALLETRNALEAGGFQVIAAAAFLAEHSIVRSIAAGRPDAQDEALCRQFAADVMAKADHAVSVQVPGNKPYKELKPSAFLPPAMPASGAASVPSSVLLAPFLWRIPARLWGMCASTACAVCRSVPSSAGLCRMLS